MCCVLVFLNNTNLFLIEHTLMFLQQQMQTPIL